MQRLVDLGDVAHLELFGRELQLTVSRSTSAASLAGARGAVLPGRFFSSLSPRYDMAYGRAG